MFLFPTAREELSQSLKEAVVSGPSGDGGSAWKAEDTSMIKVHAEHRRWAASGKGAGNPPTVPAAATVVIHKEELEARDDGVQEVVPAARSPEDHRGCYCGYRSIFSAPVVTAVVLISRYQSTDCPPVRRA